MSARNGDKARFHRKRKAKIRARIRNRKMRKALKENASKANSAQA